MRRLKDWLRTADPWQHQPPSERDALLRAARARLTARNELRLARRVGRPAVAEATPRWQSWLARPRYVGWAVVVWAVVAMAGLALWQRADTPVLAAVRFEVRLAEASPSPGLREAPVGATPRLVYLHEASVVSNDHVAGARVVGGSAPGRFGVEVVFTPEGARRMVEATRAHVGRPVALLLDGLVVLAPTLRSTIADRAILSGDYTLEQAERIARGMLVR